MKTRQVEMVVCFGDGTWKAEQFVDIPVDTPDNDVEDVARKLLLSSTDGESFNDVAGIWLYNDSQTLDRKCVLKRIILLLNDAVNRMGGSEIAAMWNEWSEQKIRYVGNDLFEEVT